MVVRDKHTGTTVIQLGDNLDRDGELEVVSHSAELNHGIATYLDRRQLEKLQRHITHVLEKSNG